MESTASFFKGQDIPDGNNTENIMSGYRLIDITIFKSLISSLACPDCLAASKEESFCFILLYSLFKM